MDKKDVIHTHTHTHNVYYSATKKNEILPFATTWIDLQGIMLSEISYIEKDKYCMIFFYVDSKKYNKPKNITKKKQAQTHRRNWWFPVGRSWEGQYKSGRVANHWVQGRLKDVLYITGNVTNIL